MKDEKHRPTVSSAKIELSPFLRRNLMAGSARREKSCGMSNSVERLIYLVNSVMAEI